jgi:hypothetical protein
MKRVLARVRWESRFQRYTELQYLPEDLMKLKPILLIIALVSAATITLLSAGDGPQKDVIKPPYDPKVHGTHARTSSTQILYHGGPVMVFSNSVYVIYYGNNFAATTQPILNDFFVSLNGSPEYGVNGTYNQPPGAAFVPPSYAFTAPSSTTPDSMSGSVYFDSGSQGTSLGSSSIPAIVKNAITSPNGLPVDPNGVYFVITSPDVAVSGFCRSFCAYHNHSSTIAPGMSIRYALVPDPGQRCTGCDGNVALGQNITPNGDMAADEMTDSIIHELSETVTDPDISAWYTKNGAENGDLCNYNYGTIKTADNGAFYNAVLGKRNYLIQLIWKNANPGFCAAK